MMLTVLMDLEFKSISPQRRVAIIETIAGYLGLPQVRNQRDEVLLKLEEFRKRTSDEN